LNPLEAALKKGIGFEVGAGFPTRAIIVVVSFDE